MSKHEGGDRQPQRGRVGQALQRYFRTPWLPEDHPVNRSPTWHYVLILAVLVPAGIGGIVMIVMHFVQDDSAAESADAGAGAGGAVMSLSTHIAAVVIGVIVAGIALTIPGREEGWPRGARLALAVVIGVMATGLVYVAEAKSGPLY